MCSERVIMNGTNISLIIFNVARKDDLPKDIREMLDLNDTEIVEIIYMILFFMIGTPINANALFKSLKIKRDGWSELRLIRLSRHLLIAHLMVLCIYCLWRTFWFVNVFWTLGPIACKFYSFITALPFHLWSNMVAAIAVDMYFCLTSPLHSVHTGHTRVSILIIAAWGFAIVCSIPMVVFRGVEDVIVNNSIVIINGEKMEQCMHLQTHFALDTLLGFNLFHVLTTFYVPLIIIVVSYSLIGLSLRKQIIQRATLRSDSSKWCRSTQIKFLKATVAIIATFVFTWLPYQVLALLQVLCANSYTCQNVLSKVYWLEAIIIASTCINPFLYKFNTRHKRGPVAGNSSFVDSDRVRSQITQTKTTSVVNRSQTFDSHSDRYTQIERVRNKGLCNRLLPSEKRSLVIPSTRVKHVPRLNSLNLLPVPAIV